MKKWFGFMIMWSAMLGADARELPEIEDSIAVKFEKLRNASTDQGRIEASNEMEYWFEEAFTHDEAFLYPFEKINICRIISTDERVRLINWNVSMIDGTHRYVCYVLLANAEKKKKNSAVFSWQKLTDAARQTENAASRFFTSENWYGALYYDIIPMGKRGKSERYTLLGWEGKDNLTTTKVIDVLTLNNGKLKFGAEIFTGGPRNAKRIFLEYGNDVSCSVKYYGRQNHIVCDHLSPRNSIMKGIYADYGPDGSYDRWVLEKGKWMFEENIDVSQYSESDRRPWKDPSKK